MKIMLLMAGMLLALLLTITPAHAHTLSVSHLDIVVPAEGAPLSIELDLSLRDLALTLPLDANRDDKVTWGELTAVRSQLEALVANGLTLATNAGECEITPRGLATRHYDDGGYATLQMQARCPSSGPLHVHYSLLFDRDPQHRALITVRRGAAVVTAIARDDAQKIIIPLAGGHPFFDFLREGIHHILIGYDHLAFLISLLLPAILIRVGGRGEPAPGFRTSLGHVLGIVTAFTLAHSITLSLTALGLVTPATRWVESGIALSVLVAALNNVRPVMTRRIWMIAFGFGLVHGFGFAGALTELGLPTGARLAALIGFNVGVEIGQLSVVAVVLPILYLLRKRRWYGPWLMRPASLAISVVAAWWLFKRLGG